MTRSKIKHRPKTLRRAPSNRSDHERAVLDALRDPLLVLNGHLIVSFANRAYYNTFHVTHDRTLGKSFYEIDAHVWDTPKLRRLLQGVIDKDASFDDFEIEYTLPRRGRRTFVLNARLLSHKAGDPVLVLLSIEDITLRKRLEKRRQRNAIIESSQHSIYSATLDGVIQTWNPAAEILYGYSSNEIIGQNVSILVPPALRPELAAAFERIGRGESVHAYETERMVKNGGRVHIRVALSPIHDVEGKIIGVSSIASDITELKRAEEQRGELTAKILHQEKLAAVGLLASGLAHEIGNPLASIQAICDNLLRKSVEPQLEEKLRRIRDQVGRIVKIVRQLVDFSRRETEVWRAISVNDEIDAALTMARLARSAKSVDVKLYLDPKLPETFALGDQLAQVFLNLFVNAFDAMSDTGGELSVHSARSNGNRIRISVADNGAGISEENLKNIFMPFFTTKEPGKGTGLGLHISQGIVKRHDGELRVESAVGRGSAFTVEIPIRRERPRDQKGP